MVRLLRYSGVSAVATTTSLFTLFVLVGLVGVPAVWANVVATAVGTVPSFELNRRWVWARQDRRSLLGQVAPFTALSFAGLLVSTVTVGLVSGRTVEWGHWAHTLAVEVANVAAYGCLWVVQYIVLDRFLFRSSGGSGRQGFDGPGAGGLDPSGGYGGAERGLPRALGAIGNAQPPDRALPALSDQSTRCALGGNGVTQPATSTSTTATAGAGATSRPPGLSSAGASGSSAPSGTPPSGTRNGPAGGFGAAAKGGTGGKVSAVFGDTITLTTMAEKTITVTVTASTGFKDGTTAPAQSALKKGTSPW